MDNSLIKPLRVLVIAGAFPPIGAAGSVIRLVKHIKYLTWDGFCFSVLTRSDIQNDSWHSQPKSSRVLLEEVPNTVRVTRCAPLLTPPGSNPSSGGESRRQRRSFFKQVAKFLGIRHLIFPDPDVFWVPRALRVGLQEAFAFRPHVVYSVAPPVSMHLVGMAISKKLRVPFVVEYKDDRIGTREYAGLPFAIRVMHAHLERYLVSQSGLIVTVTRSSATGFATRYPKISRRVVLLPNGVDLAEFEQCGSEIAFNDEGKFVIVNAGGYAKNYRDATPFFQALICLLRQRPELRAIIKVEFIGENAHRDYYHELMELGDVFKEVPPLNRRSYVGRLKSANLLLLIQAIGYPTSVAGTFYEYWAAGNAPILMIGEPGELWDHVAGKNLGLAATRADTQTIKKYIEGIVDKHCEKVPVKISREGIYAYDRAHIARELGTKLRDLAEAKDRHR